MEQKHYQLPEPFCMFRFTIRELLCFMVVVAFAICWWIDRRDSRRRDLHNAARLATQEQQLKAKDAQLAAIRTKLEHTKAEESAIREQLAEFVETQEDKLKIDVGPPGFFRRLAHPQVAEPARRLSSHDLPDG